MQNVDDKLMNDIRSRQKRMSVASQKSVGSQNSGLLTSPTGTKVDKRKKSNGIADKKDEQDKRTLTMSEIREQLVTLFAELDMLIPNMTSLSDGLENNLDIQRKSTRLAIRAQINLLIASLNSASAQKKEMQATLQKMLEQQSQALHEQNETFRRSMRTLAAYFKRFTDDKRNEDRVGNATGLTFGLLGLAIFGGIVGGLGGGLPVAMAGTMIGFAGGLLTIGTGIGRNFYSKLGKWFSCCCGGSNSEIEEMICDFDNPSNTQSKAVIRSSTKNSTSGDSGMKSSEEREAPIPGSVVIDVRPNGSGAAVNGVATSVNSVTTSIGAASSVNNVTTSIGAAAGLNGLHTNSANSAGGVNGANGDNKDTQEKRASSLGNFTAESKQRSETLDSFEGNSLVHDLEKLFIELTKISASSSTSLSGPEVAPRVFQGLQDLQRMRGQKQGQGQQTQQDRTFSGQSGQAHLELAPVKNSANGVTSSV